MNLRNLWRLRKLTNEQINALLDNADSIPLPIESDAKGVFIPDMTEDEYVQYQRVKSGWQKFIDKLGGK